MIIDTHMHLLDERFNIDRSLVIARAKQVGISKFIEVTCEVKSWEQARKLAEDEYNIFMSLGIHPINACCIQQYSYNNILQKMAKYHKCVAIGEIGLDYHDKPSYHEVLKQKLCFIQQLNIALNLNKPVIIHCRDAYEDAINILSQYNMGLKGVIHCFSGSLKYAQEFLKLGFLLGVDGPITYSTKLQYVISQISINNIVVETDSPYLVPNKHKNHITRNEPCYITSIIEQIAKIKNISYHTVLKHTTNNALKLFNLK
ncbi:MAG: TatD family hydrolase [Endomicrobium sp.]|jgi:TatD DNase family protein|nr:TatD family hydrolase [Endomicrobium sp.]